MKPFRSEGNLCVEERYARKQHEVLCCAYSKGPTVEGSSNGYMTNHGDIEDVVAKVNVEEDTKQKFKAVLQKRRSVFATVPGKCKVFQYTIEVNTNDPLVKKHARFHCAIVIR